MSKKGCEEFFFGVCGDVGNHSSMDVRMEVGMTKTNEDIRSDMLRDVKVM